MRSALIIASLGGLALVAWGMARVGRDLDEALAGVFGDVARLPEGLRPARNVSGGRSEQGGRAVTRTKDHGSHSMMGGASRP